MPRIRPGMIVGQAIGFAYQAASLIFGIQDFRFVSAEPKQVMTWGEAVNSNFEGGGDIVTRDVIIILSNPGLGRIKVVVDMVGEAPYDVRFNTVWRRGNSVVMEETLEGTDRDLAVLNSDFHLEVRKWTPDPDRLHPLCLPASGTRDGLVTDPVNQHRTTRSWLAGSFVSRKQYSSSFHPNVLAK